MGDGAILVAAMTCYAVERMVRWYETVYRGILTRYPREPSAETVRLRNGSIR
jgi:hypothetical protein